MTRSVLVIPDSDVWRELEALERQVRYALTPAGRTDPQIWDSIRSILADIDALRGKKGRGWS